MDNSSQWVLIAVALVGGGTLGVVVKALIDRKRPEERSAERNEVERRSEKTASETFHTMMEDLAAAHTKQEELRDKIDGYRDQIEELKEDRDRFKARAENYERKERRRLSQEAQKPRILLVEDNDETREMLMFRFRNCPFRAEFARDGTDALEQYDEAIRLGFPFTLLVLDYAMPGLSGVDVAQKVREGGDVVTKMVFYTAYPLHVVEERIGKLNAMGVIPKSVDVNGLEEAVVKLLA